jgi:hypothetical protein
MKQKLKLPADFGFPVWSYIIDSDKIIKAEAKCLIWTEHLSEIDIGDCQPYLAQYGLDKGAIERFYQDARRYRSYSRKQKRIKNVLKVKVFFYAILTQLNQRGIDLNFFLSPKCHMQ